MIDREHVVEVVRDAAGELSDRLHLLHLAKLALRLLPSSHLRGELGIGLRKFTRAFRHARFQHVVMRAHLLVRGGEGVPYDSKFPQRGFDWDRTLHLSDLAARDRQALQRPRDEAPEPQRDHRCYQKCQRAKGNEHIERFRQRRLYYRLLDIRGDKPVSERRMGVTDQNFFAVRVLSNECSFESRRASQERGNSRLASELAMIFGASERRCLCCNRRRR